MNSDKLNELKLEKPNGNADVEKFLATIKEQVSNILSLYIMIDTLQKIIVLISLAFIVKLFQRILHFSSFQNSELSAQLTELKRLLALDQALSKDPNAVVYVGDEMELLLRKTEENIESKMKLQTLLIVVLAYGIVGISAPLLYLWYNRDL